MGKSSIIYVMGLSMIVSLALLNMNSSTTDAVQNFSLYYSRTVAHNIAVSGANIGCGDVFRDSNYTTPYTNIDFLGGKMNITFTVTGNQKFITSVGSIDIGHVHVRDTIIAQLRNQSLARYAWFTNFEANRGGQITSWSTGDTAFGPAHTNDKFNINGSPAFMKKATAWQSAVPKKNDAVWAGGYEWGLKLPYPDNLSAFVTAATDPVNGRSVVNKDAVLDFNSSGSIRLQVPTAGYDSTFANADAFAKNGAFAVVGGNLTVHGTVVGDLAIGAVTTPLMGGGNVYVSGDIKYKTDPRIYPTSTDQLVMYAENDIQVTYDHLNPALYYNRQIDASIFSLKGEFNVQDYKTDAPRGTLQTYGALMQYYRGAVGDINPGNGTLKSGYYKGFHFDERLTKKPPKYYPATGRYLLYSWREN